MKRDFFFEGEDLNQVCREISPQFCFCCVLLHLFATSEKGRKRENAENTPRKCIHITRLCPRGLLYLTYEKYNSATPEREIVRLWTKERILRPFRLPRYSRSMRHVGRKKRRRKSLTHNYFVIMNTAHLAFIIF